MKKLSLIPYLCISTLFAMEQTPISLDQMHIEDKIAQLIILATVSEPGVNRELVKKSLCQIDPDNTDRYLQKLDVGGVALVGYGTIFSAKKRNQRVKFLAASNPFIAIDAEWGLGMRLDDATRYPRNITLGALSSKDNHLIYQLGKQIGNECRALGFNMNLAPVADINSNTDNPIIQIRSFGQNPHKVGYKALQFAKGLQDAGVISVVKHAPGHGDTTEDSHETLPYLDHDQQQLKEVELVPFKYLFDNGIETCMTAHIALPNITEEKNVPATLSRRIITNILKRQLNCQLVVTDALDMKGITDQYEPGEAELKALQAGCDILLFPRDVEKTIYRIKKAITDGEFSEEKLNRKILKIQKLKNKFKLSHAEWHDSEILKNGEGKRLKRLLFHKAFTMIKKNKLPLKTDQMEEPLEIISFDNSPNPYFIHILESETNVTYTPIKPNTSPRQFNRLLSRLKDKKNVVVTVHIPSKPGVIQLNENNDLPQNIKEAISLSKNHILILFGHPYNLKYFDDNPSDICIAYEDDEYAQEAAALALVGKLSPTGQLPVTISDKYKEGFGLTYQ